LLPLLNMPAPPYVPCPLKIRSADRLYDIVLTECATCLAGGDCLLCSQELIKVNPIAIERAIARWRGVNAERDNVAIL
jgi:hypothetical protein